MPSVSKKQARFMAAAAHNPKFAKRVGIKSSVAKDFNQADVGTGILKGKRPIKKALGGQIGMQKPRSLLPGPGSPIIPGSDRIRAADSSILNAQRKLTPMRGRLYANGGKVGASVAAIKAIKDAISHLENKDVSQAAQTLRNSRDAMMHPAVAQAAASLTSSAGVPKAAKTLTDIVRAESNQNLMPTY